MDNINSFYGIVTDKFVVLPMNIFITGASSGIGEYVAYEYSKRGATIALCARRKEKLENIAQKLIFWAKNNPKKIVKTKAIDKSSK